MKGASATQHKKLKPGFGNTNTCRMPELRTSNQALGWMRRISVSVTNRSANPSLHLSDYFASGPASSIISFVMHGLARDGMLLLESLFILGWVGSLVVVVISGIQDMHTILQKDKDEPSAAISGDHVV